MTQVLTLNSAGAVEGGVFDYPTGIAGPFLGAFPVDPGLYLINQGFVQPTGQPYGSNGKPTGSPVRVSSDGFVERFTLADPGDFMGIKFYQRLIIPFVDLSVNTPGGTSQKFGPTNTIIGPLIMNKYLDKANSVSAGFEIATQLSSFDSANPVNVALNYTSFQPVIGYRYFVPNGLALAFALRGLFNTTNSITNYHSGNAVNLDFSAAYSFGSFQIGAVGGYARQVGNDTVAGLTVPGGNRFQNLLVGPSLSYQMGNVVLNVNYEFDAVAVNKVRSDRLLLNVALPLYTIPKAGVTPPPVVN